MYSLTVKFHVHRTKRSGKSLAMLWPQLPTDTAKAPDESWYFDAAMSEQGFELLALPPKAKESIKKIVEDERLKIATNLFGILPDPPILLSLARLVNVDFKGPTNIFFRSQKPAAIIIQDAVNCFVVLSANKQDCDKIVNDLQNSFQRLSSITKDFGYELDFFIMGKNFAKNWITSLPSVKGIAGKKSKNDFERKVVEILSSMTDSFVSNTEVFFLQPSESFEYDIILVLSDKMVIVIEVKDYKTSLQDIKKTKVSEPFKDNIKSHLLLRTVDKATRISPHVQIVLILRGFPNPTFTSISELAKSRGILLFNDYDLEHKLKRLLNYLTAGLIPKSNGDFYKNLEKFLSYKYKKGPLRGSI
jgi:hypothetical protein